MITWTTWSAGLSPAEAAWFAACCTWWIAALSSNPRCDACFAHDGATATEVLQWVYHRLYPTSQIHISFLDLLQDAQNANLLNKITPKTRACIPCGCLVVESYAHTKETQTTVHPILPYFLPGWWYTYPSEKSWSSSVGMIFHSQLFLESQNPFHGSSHHQPDKLI